MIEILEFIFSSIWHFLGVCLLMIIFLSAIADIIKTIKTPRFEELKELHKYINDLYYKQSKTNDTDDE